MRASFWWKAWGTPFSPVSKLSVVSIVLPLHETASTVHEYTASPSTIAVQAPQLARSQTRLGPVTSRRLRSVSSSVLLGSTVQDRSSPLTLSVSSTSPERSFGSESAAFCSSSAAVAGPVRTAEAAARPDPRRKSRRLGPPGPPLVLGSCSGIKQSP